MPASTDPNAGRPSIEEVAFALAPNIRFHPEETHFPCSVHWYVGRCRIVSGEGALAPDTSFELDVATHFHLPDSMSVLMEGPLWQGGLPPTTLGTPADGAEVDSISFYPMEAAPRAEAAWTNELSTRVYFSDFQLETLRGEPIEDHCKAECYCRITEDAGQYRVSYYFLCAYNGGMGPTANRGDLPLAGGFYAHIGDWMRVTALVSIAQGLVTLHGVEYDAHGEVTTKTDGACAFSGKPLREVTRIPAYSAWHSHEMYPTTGSFPVPGLQGVVVQDVTGEGVAWPTWKYLLLIDDSLASVRYKGLWGANIKVFNAYAGRAAGLPTMKNGPSGPAYKTAWFKGTQHVSPPFVPPAGGPNTKDVLSLTPESLDFGITHGARTQLDLVLENKLSEPMTVRLQVVSAIAADWDSRKVGEPLYPAILSIGPIARSGLKLEPNERTIVPVIAQIQIPSSKIGSKLSIYSPSRFKGYVAASAMGKDGWIVVPVTGGINGGALKRGGPSGFISDVKIKEGDIPPLDLSDQAIG